MPGIKNIATCDISKLKDDEILSHKSELKKQSKIFESLSDNIKEYIGTGKSPVKIKEIRLKYGTLVELWNLYKGVVQQEAKKREVDLMDTFGKKILNIKLKSFIGYSSTIDFYTFKSNFKKLYEDSVPKSLPADLLKNTHLEKQALSLVKNV